MLPRRISQPEEVLEEHCLSNFEIDYLADALLLRMERAGDVVLGLNAEGKLTVVNDLRKKRNQRRRQRAMKKFHDAPAGLEQELRRLEQAPRQPRTPGIHIRDMSSDERKEYNRIKAAERRRKNGARQNQRPGLKTLSQDEMRAYRRQHRVRPPPPMP